MNDVAHTNTQVANYNYDAGNDWDEFDSSDIIMPRIELMHPQSPAVNKGTYNAGDLVLKTGEVLVQRGEAITVIFAGFWKEFVRWNPNREDKENRILDRSTDPQGELARICRQRVKVKNSDGKEVNVVTDTFNVMLLIPERSWEEIYLISMSRSNYGVWKQFGNFMRNRKWDNPITGLNEQMPIFGAAYPFGTYYEDNAKNPHWKLTIDTQNAEILNSAYLTPVSEIATRLKAQIEELKAANGTTADQDEEVVVVDDLDKSAQAEL